MLLGSLQARPACCFQAALWTNGASLEWTWEWRMTDFFEKTQAADGWWSTNGKPRELSMPWFLTYGNWWLLMLINGWPMVIMPWFLSNGNWWLWLLMLIMGLTGPHWLCPMDQPLQGPWVRSTEKPMPASGRSRIRSCKKGTRPNMGAVANIVCWLVCLVVVGVTYLLLLIVVGGACGLWGCIVPRKRVVSH